MFDIDFDNLAQTAPKVAKFAIGAEVVDPTSGLAGKVYEVKEPPYDYMEFQYRVVLSNGKATSFTESGLQEKFDTDDVFALCENRNFASYDDYMIVNTLFKIDNVNSNTISTLRASRTQFKAYQFKPLLKFFASPERRLLIADEVGLGKTIEAGHILLELRARKEFRHALIVCPKSLREKWKTEMHQRFGLEFTIYGGEDNEGNKYPTMDDLRSQYKSGHDVHAIINYERIRFKQSRKVDAGAVCGKTFVDYILENDIRHSVVICDESHRLRNDNTLWFRGAEKLLGKSDAVIFLTATPVMIKEDNLYNQMHLLCPEKYADAQIFANRMSQGRPFVLALSELSAGQDLHKIWERLHSQKIERIIQTDTKYGVISYKKEMTVEKSFADDPIYERIRDLFDNEPDNARTRAALQLNLVKMSAIQNEFTRTTKKQILNEISKVNERFPCKISVTLTPEEQKEFDRVINDYDERENATGSASLGLVQIKRMVSSSVYGYCNKREDLERGVDAFSDRHDSKVDALIREILNPSESNHNREIKKVIVFAVFVDTLRYLKIRLERRGIRCAMIDGSVANRQDVVDGFRANDDLRVLLSSEVGSEGLDMQFCDTVVNYDLPWNPMVVEQRIGRIDRIGQLSENIYIYNFVVKGSITEDIYERLDKRIGIFKGTIGDLEPILSAPYKDGQSILEAHNNIETLFYRGEITKERALREEDLINQAIEAQKMTLAELSEKMNENAISVDSYYDEQIKFIQKRKAYVTDVELKNLLEHVLRIKDTKCSQCVLERSDADHRIWTLKVPQNLEDRDCLVEFLRSNRPQGSDSLRSYDEFVDQIRGKTELSVTFDQSVANENHRIIFINNYCPFILACNEYRNKAGIEVRRAFKFELSAKDDKSGALHAGDRFFLVNYQLEISGVVQARTTSIKELYPVLFDINHESIVSDEDVVTSVSSLAQDQGRETQIPSEEECSRTVVAKFSALATEYIARVVAEKKKEIDVQSNVERDRWRKEYRELYDGKILYYRDEMRKCAGDASRKNEMAGYSGTITRLEREREEKLAKLGYESNVSITRTEVSACYVVVK